MFFDYGNSGPGSFPVRLLTLAIAPLIIGAAACSENKPNSRQSGTPSVNANSSETTKRPLADSTVAAAAGKPLYATHCASCHGTDGKGDSDLGYSLSAKPPDLTTGAAVSGSDDEMFLVIKNGVKRNGKAPMPPASGVTDEQIRRIIAYVRALAENKKRTE
jgi:mono/diheme cytochrome c family protein